MKFWNALKETQGMEKTMRKTDQIARQRKEGGFQRRERKSEEREEEEWGKKLFACYSTIR